MSPKEVSSSTLMTFCSRHRRRHDAKALHGVSGGLARAARR